jgi:superfamily II DNA/RNA helicase
MNLQSEQFSKYLEILSIDSLTKIQSLCMEPLYNNKSVFGLAPTGSGKTLAFILPLLLKINCSIREPQTLILVPTRELGNQIASVANKVSSAIFSIDKKNVLIRTAFGGTPIASQVEELAKKPHVIIATPGRVLDLLERDALSFDHLNNLILDEADIMVGMGFSEQVEAICNHLPIELQVGLFSATKNEKVSELEKLLLKNAKYITAKIDNEDNNTSENDLQPPNISHCYILSSKEGKYKSLKSLLKNVSNGEIKKGIIFCHTRETSHQLAEALKNEGFEAEALTGELGQVHRNSIMRNFKTGNLKFLVATNIASRGIDISKLPLVIHYDIPYTNEEYIHRSGRTGRAGNSGTSVSICEEKNLSYYLNMMQEIGLTTKKYSYESIEKFVDVENTNTSGEKSRKKISFVKMYINKGKQDKMRPGDILGAFIKELSFAKEDIGNIFIFDNFTHVEVNEDKKEVIKKSKFKIKNLQIKITEAK